MNHRESNRAIATPKGGQATVAAGSHSRRERQRAPTEIGAGAPARLRNDLAPQLTLAVAPTERLTPASQPTRRSDQAQSERIGNSIKRLGICRPSLVNGDLKIIEGRAIWVAAKELRIVEVPCIVVDHLDDASEQQLRSLVLLTMLGGDVRPRRLGWACARTASDVDDPDSNGEEEDDHEQAWSL